MITERERLEASIYAELLKLRTWTEEIADERGVVVVVRADVFKAVGEAFKAVDVRDKQFASFAEARAALDKMDDGVEGMRGLWVYDDNTGFLHRVEGP